MQHTHTQKKNGHFDKECHKRWAYDFFLFWIFSIFFFSEKTKHSQTKTVPCWQIIVCNDFNSRGGRFSFLQLSAHTHHAHVCVNKKEYYQHVTLLWECACVYFCCVKSVVHANKNCVYLVGFYQTANVLRSLQSWPADFFFFWLFSNEIDISMMITFVFLAFWHEQNPIFTLIAHIFFRLFFSFKILSR